MQPPDGTSDTPTPREGPLATVPPHRTPAAERPFPPTLPLFSRTARGEGADAAAQLGFQLAKEPVRSQGAARLGLQAKGLAKVRVGAAVQHGAPAGFIAEVFTPPAKVQQSIVPFFAHMYRPLDQG